MQEVEHVTTGEEDMVGEAMKRGLAGFLAGLSGVVV